MKKIFFLTLLIFFCVFTCFAQNWRLLDSLCYEYGDAKPDTAIILGKKAIEGCIKEKGLNSIEYASLLNHIAYAYKNKAIYPIADSLYRHAVQICRNTNNTETLEYGEIANNLGLLFNELGKYAQAEPLYIESKELTARLLGKNHSDYAVCCNNLAMLYKNQGKYSEAESLYKESITIRAKLFGREHPKYATPCNNLAALYEDQERYSEAESLYTISMQIRKKVFGKDHPFYLVSCNNMAVLLEKQGRYSEAESLHLEVKKIKLKLLGKDHPSYAVTCNNLGMLYKLQKNYLKAETLYKEGLNIRIRALGKEHPDYTQSCQYLASVFDAQNKLSESEPYYIEAITYKRGEIERNFANLSEAEKEQYVNANVGLYFNRFHRFVSEYFFQKPEISIYGYELSLLTKGLILSSSEKIKNRILGSNNEELKKLYSEWKITKDKYDKALNITIEQRKQKKINLDSLRSTANDYEKKLSLKSEDFANVFTPKSVNWKDIQHKLQKNEASIEIVKYQKTKNMVGYMAYIIKKDSPYPEVVLFNDGNELEKSLEAYRRTIRAKLKDDFSYNSFWKPIADKLKGIKQVYFCPDGVYYQINLNTLQNPETNKYVFDEIKITQLTNSKDIIRPKKQFQNGVYLIGNPKYDLQKNIPKDNQRKVEFMDFSSGISQLQGAENEVKGIDSLIKKKNKSTVLYIQEQATEEAVKAITNPRILHIATHGYFKRGKYQTAEQAMRNAGLLMAGVVDTDRMSIRSYDKEDGKLTAFEIMNMELDSTELVVLSACETGLGEVNTEGVYGLQRAFKVAGANTIIMSLWKVDDFATQKLMKIFYYYWQTKNMDKKSAFLKAQSDLRKTNPEPYYWGAFLMIE